MQDGINKYLIPTRVRVTYEDNPETGKRERVCYVECANGEMLTYNVPFDWSQYISYAINKNYYAGMVKQTQMSNPIAILRIDGLPNQRSESSVVTQDEQGNFIIVDNPEYLASIERAGLLGEELFCERWTQLPITEPIAVSCIFNVTGSKQYVLPQCEAWILDLLHKLNIIKSKSHRIVRSMTGSQFRQTKEEPCVIVIIRKVQV